MTLDDRLMSKKELLSKLNRGMKKSDIQKAAPHNVIKARKLIASRKEARMTLKAQRREKQLVARQFRETRAH